MAVATRRRLWPVAVALSICVGLFGLASAASAYVVPMLERRLTTNDMSQAFSAISGTKVVYEDERNSIQAVYLYDLATGTETRLGTSDQGQAAPAISGTKVVYEDVRNGNDDIYLFDVATGVEKRLTLSDQQQYNPAISGTKVVYEDVRNGNSDIYLYDLVTSAEKRLTTDGQNQYVPAISGTKVVYQDVRNGNSDIYLYDLRTSTETRLTNNDQQQYNSAISGNMVVYEDTRNGNLDIYLYDLATSTETRLTTNNQAQRHPAIAGTKVVYEDERTGNSDIYLYDLAAGTETRLTTDAADQRRPAIDGGRVVWDDARNIQRDVYLGELAIPRIAASAPSVVAFNAGARLTGALSSVTGIPIAGRQVVLEVSTDTVNWSVAGTAVSGSGGTFSITSPRLVSARYLRANFQGDGGYLSAQSSPVLVKPKVHLTQPSFGSTTLSYGKAYVARGYLKPRHSSGTFPVKIEAYRYSSGKYRWVKTYSAKAYDYSSYTRYVKSLALPARGEWRLRAVHAEDALNAKTYSSWQYATVQ